MLMWPGFGFIFLVYNLKTSESIRWPAGKYGLPKPVSGCPKAVGFQWKEGWLSQDTNGDISNNSKSKEFHLDGVVDDRKVNRSFCTKLNGTRNQGRPTWPAGRYCIYKSGKCPPTDLNGGTVHWDDDDTKNANAQGGTLPSGVKQVEHNDTEIRFCCKTDGDKSRPILLPSETPFFLLAYETANCQMVKWAVASLEWIYYDTEHYHNADHARGAYPFDGGQKHPTIYYCYYRSCNETLTGAYGTFHSPNHPNNYPDGQYCSWRITVRPGQQIHLKFTNFSLEDPASTDVLEIYDGENETGIALGMFYGLKPPPKEGINSSSNHMFLIFKSDITVSYTGFSAFYCEGNCSDETTSTTMATQTSEISSSVSVTPKTLLTFEKTSATTDGPSDASGGKDQSKQSRGKGFDVVAVVVPVVVLVLVVAFLVAVLFYYKRRKRKKEEDQGVQNEIVYARPYEGTPMSVENVCYERTTVGAPMSVDNPCYERTTGEPPMSVDNPCYDSGVYSGLSVGNISSGLYSGLTIANRGCTTEENEVYTEVNEMDNVGENNVFDDQQQSDNPTYETHGDAVFNPIYDVSSM